MSKFIVFYFAFSVCAMVAMAEVTGTYDFDKMLNQTLIGTTKLAPGCTLKTCPNALNGVNCTIRSIQTAVSSIIAQFQTCFKDNKGSCGMNLADISLSPLTLSLDGVGNGSNMKCTLDSKETHKINSQFVSNIDLSVKSWVDQTNDLFIYNVPIGMKFVIEPATYNCLTTTPTSPPKKRSIVYPLAQFWFAFRRILSCSSQPGPWTGPKGGPKGGPKNGPKTEQNTGPSEPQGVKSVITIGPINYDGTANAKISFDKNTNHYVRDYIPYAPMVSVTGSYSKDTPPEVQKWLTSYYQSTAFSSAVFGNILPFLVNVLRACWG